MPLGDRLALEAAFDYPEDSAGRIMQRDVFSAPSFMDVGTLIDRLRTARDLPDEFFEIYVVDPANRVTWASCRSTASSARPDHAGHELIIDDHPLVRDTMDQEEVAYLFEKYNLISAPVVDEAQRLVGAVTVDDIVEVVREEGDEDMLALAGVGQDEAGAEPVRAPRRAVPLHLAEREPRDRDPGELRDRPVRRDPRRRPWRWRS